VIFRQFVDDGLGCASYLIGDENEGVAAVVDPAYAVEQYVEEAERQGVRLVRVLETHTHADHLSGHGRLARKHGCTVSIHPIAAPEYEFEPLADGQELELGAVVIRVIHTPGHRPEHCAFAVVDRAQGDEPLLVLTGDSLFVGDVARPDLAVGADEGAEGLFHSLRRLAEMPDGVQVFPGHVAGSLCGAAMSSEPSTTIGFERRFNPSLQFTSAAEFVDANATTTQLRPPNMERIVALNRGPFVGAPGDLQQLNEGDAGATILDVRDADAFARGHAHGALNVPVDGSSFSTQAAFLLGPDERIAIHAASVAEAERAARGLRAVALLDLAGFVLDPPAEDRIEPLDVDELQPLLEREEVEVLDVREKDERDDGYIPGTRHVPYRLLRAMGADVNGGKPIVTICSTGSRAAIAASVLTAAGVDARPVLHGGVSTWPGQTVEFRRCGG
jgi:glyoxylase-like metal-dependent hydrolase (beta-lactamase superfamily II)/rhodanese-related sulfurtransferase